MRENNAEIIVRKTNLLSTSVMIVTYYSTYFFFRPNGQSQMTEVCQGFTKKQKWSTSLTTCLPVFSIELRLDHLYWNISVIGSYKFVFFSH